MKLRQPSSSLASRDGRAVGGTAAGQMIDYATSEYELFTKCAYLVLIQIFWTRVACPLSDTSLFDLRAAS